MHMEIPPRSKLQASNDDEEDQLEEFEDGDDCIAFQESAQDGAKIIYPERIMQVGFSLASPELRAKRRKAEIIEVCGGRVIRSGGGRRDRHSKVCTARGTRDRRVRLSPKTAIQFYDVQDRLGYDRPSKAIDWLMKEAKVAIDALQYDQLPVPMASDTHFDATNVAENHGPQQSECGMTHNLEHLFDDNVISSFDFFTNGAAPLCSSEFQAYTNHDFSEDSILNPGYDDGFFSPPLPTDTNLELARLQRIFTWKDYSSVSSLPLHFPELGHSHMFSQWEPLQSIYPRTANYPPINTPFPGISFSNNELPNFTKQNEEEEDKFPVSSKTFSSTSFLHYEE